MSYHVAPRKIQTKCSTYSWTFLTSSDTPRTKIFDSSVLKKSDTKKVPARKQKKQDRRAYTSFFTGGAAHTHTPLAHAQKFFFLLRWFKALLQQQQYIKHKRTAIIINNSSTIIMACRGRDLIIMVLLLAAGATQGFIQMGVRPDQQQQLPSSSPKTPHRAASVIGKLSSSSVVEAPPSPPLPSTQALTAVPSTTQQRESKDGDGKTQFNWNKQVSRYHVRNVIRKRASGLVWIYGLCLCGM